jgi:hypothetical protein
MSDPQKPSGEAILAVLRIAKESGVSKLGRTALTKFVYLLDLYAAEERGGGTVTGAAWKFWHFGPYAADLDAEIDVLASSGSIQSESRENVDKEYTLFYLGEWSGAKALEALGVSHEARTRLADMIKQYSFDLPGLLNHVYFETTPMSGARPGDALDFSKAERLMWARDVKPHKFGMPDKAKAKRAQELMAKLGENRRARAYKLPTPPVYDEHYARAIAGAEEDFELPEGPHRARLNFE